MRVVLFVFFVKIRSYNLKKYFFLKVFIYLLVVVLLLVFLFGNPVVDILEQNMVLLLIE